LIKLLAKTNVLDLVHGGKGGEIFVVHRDDSLSTVMKILADKNIKSVPVLTKEEKFYGFIDILDCLKFLVDLLGEHVVTKADFDVYAADEFKAATVGKLMTYPYSKKNPFHPVTSSQSLISVVELMAKGLHRIPVVDESGHVVNIISQSSFIHIINKYFINPVGGEDHTTIEHLAVGSSPVLSVSKTESVINTFRILDLKNKSGIALVDNTGRLVGTTTGKDLGLFLKSPTLATLNQSIFEHLQHIRSSETIDIKTPCIAVFPKDTLSRAIALIAATRVHRVFVVDNEEHYRPIRVISVTDILNLLLS